MTHPCAQGGIPTSALRPDGSHSIADRVRSLLHWHRSGTSGLLPDQITMLGCLALAKATISSRYGLPVLGLITSFTGPSN